MPDTSIDVCECVCVCMFVYIIIIIIVLPKGRSFTASAAVLPKAGFPPHTQDPRLPFYQGLNRYSSFPLLSAPHTLFSIWTDFKRSEKIPGAPTWRWGEWIWLIGPSGLHRNSTQGLNISSIRVFNQIRDLEITITLYLLYVCMYIQGVTGPHRQNDRDDRPCREDNFLCRNIYSQTCRSWVMRMYQGARAMHWNQLTID